MFMPKLTAQYVRDIPFAVKGQTLVTDDALPGFGVRVGARAKSYFAESRVKGRTRRVTIGRADTLTLSEARKLAMKALAEMADGKDRNAALKRERAKLMTLGQAVDGWIAERGHRASTATTWPQRRSACAVSPANGARPWALSSYTPGLPSRMPRPTASAPMGQPPLGDGVRPALATTADQPRPTVGNAISSAVRRAGSQDSASSTRAAHLPAQVQTRPCRSPR